MEGAAFTNSVSMIFNKGYQEQQLRSLRKSLSSDQNNVLATILAERLKSSFGLRALPSLDDVLPFIHFDDAGQTHFTLIYASSLLSPFALICSHYFGRPLMNLQREVYHMLYSNTLNISDCDASEEESPSEPPVLAFANGVHRPSSCQQATGSSLVSSSALAEELSARREESRDDDDDSSDSLHSISARGLSPALTLTSVASANLPPPPSEELLQQTSAETAVPLKEGRAPPLATAGKTQSLAKRYQCDRCTKSFAVRSHLDSHRVTHTGEKRYKCMRCGNRFTQSSSLRNHMIAIHTRNFPHVCDQCSPPKGFLLPSQLRKHREHAHQ